jgi:peptidoglycan hydrolase-like protein with peptidoglycan-binding domain
MPTNYTIQSGDTLGKIASNYGFNDYRDIYNHPLNTIFRSKRPNPNVIYSGDVIIIPDKTETPPIIQSSTLPIIKINDKGDWVTYCQNLLNTRLFELPALWVDGEFGTATELAVRRFQAIKLLKVDGQVGNDTWQALENGPPLINKRPLYSPIIIETQGGGV